MNKFVNSARAFGIHVMVLMVSFCWIELFHLDFESGDEIWLVVILIVFYIVGGFVFLDTKPKPFTSLCLFMGYFVGVSVLLSVMGNLSILLVFVNPIGLLFADLLPLSNMFIIPSTLTNIVMAIVPPLLLYIGLMLRRLFQRHIVVSRN